MAFEEGVNVKVSIAGTPIGGQRGAKLNRSAETTDTTTKDSNGWKTKKASWKDWSIDCDGLIVTGDAGFEALETAFNNGTEVLVDLLTINGKKYSGQAIVTDFPIDAPYDDTLKYNVKFDGTGELVASTPL